MFWKRLLAVTFLGTMMILAQSGSAQTGGPTKVSRPKSFDLSAMDKTANPCEDFYQYACGTWRKNNPIPPDQARWGRFNELAEYNRQLLREILEKASVDNPKRDAVTQKIGDFYASCMDEKTVNSQGSTPIKALLDKVAAISSKDQLIDTLAYLHSLGINALFGFGAQPELHNASMEGASIFQGGLGLPDRDYYIKDDAKSKETREKYVVHVANMLKLLGDDPTAAGKEAQTIMDIETKLAQAAFDRVAMRDPKNRDHKMSVQELATLAPNFSFPRFFASTGAPSFTNVNVVPPDFFKHPPKDSMDVYTVAKQWMWKFQHSEGQREINELHIPVGRDVRVIMTSQDVIHSFYVPAFRIKQDVLPGRYTIAWFRATKAGTYHLFCAEYCGTNHSGMIGDVVVMEPAQYQSWLSGGQPMGSLSQTGQGIFQSLGCSTCHRMDTQGRGPNLMGVFGKPVLLEDGRTVTADENYIRESILSPAAKVVSGFKPIMPTFQGIVSEEQLNALVAYIKSLSPQPSGPAQTPTFKGPAAPKADTRPR